MNKQKIYRILAGCAMAVMILDTKTVLNGAQDGIQLCLQTIVPALFPFIILSGMINSAMLGQSVRFLRPFGRMCKIPEGAESLLLLGFLGGYPVGAQSVTQAYQAGSLSKTTARRMLGFCNNAGPAFLFGMFSSVFSKGIITWVLWCIHILSALTVGFLLPGESESPCIIPTAKQLSLPKALQNAIKTTTYICGWVIIFRITIALCDQWLMWRCSRAIQVIFSGILELSNGCIMLHKISSEATRFLFASCILAFGGLCVGMQTSTVTQDLGCGYYFPGKVLQTLLSLLFSIVSQPFLFKNINYHSYPFAILTLLLLICIVICLIRRKKLWHLQAECCIISVKTGQKEQSYAVSKKNNPFLQLLPTRHRHG